MIGLDTNILVALVLAEHELHGRAHAVLKREIQNGEQFALTPDVISEFLHAVTDPRRFERPLSMAQALADARYWWNSAQTCQTFPSPDATVLCLDWMQRHQLGRKRVLDTMLAATLYTAGVQRIFTSNPADFRVFGVFDLLVP